MESRFDGRCKTCGKPYKAGAEIYWSREEGGHHVECRSKTEPASGSPGLAEQLHYIPFSAVNEPIPEAWWWKAELLALPGRADL